MLFTRSTELIENYLLEHPDVFDAFEKKYLLWYSKEWDGSRDIPYFVLELYDELGILPDDKNVYKAFMKLLEKEIGIDNKRVLEVGGGIIPRLGKRISLKQNNGSITIYDPRLNGEETSTDSFQIKRERFTSNITDNYDLLVGLKPCEATEDMIRWALSNDTDFIIGLCEGGLHGEPYDFYESPEEWVRAMTYMAYRGVESHNMGELKIKKLDNCSYSYPVIYNKR